MKTDLLKKLGRINTVPAGWKLTTVGKVCKIRNDLRKPLSTEERAKIQGSYPYYGPTGVLDFIDHHLVEGQFALIGEDGDHFLKPEQKAQTLLVNGKFNVNNHAHLIQGTEKCSSEWFFLYFHHRDITHLISRQGASRYKLNKDTLSKLPILVPPLNEQLEIYKLFTTWENAIAKTEALIAAKEKQFEWLTQSIIRKRCSHWKHYLAKELFGSVSSKGHPDEELLSVTQDRGVIPRTMLKGRVMSPAGSTAGYKLVEKGNFVISLRSFQGGLEYSDYRGIVSPAYTVLSSKKEIHSGFYRHFFKSYIFIEKYLSVAVIGIRDGKQISSTDFDTVKIPYPDMDEQIKIASQLDTARQEIDLLKDLLEKYRSQKRGLMQKLLTGEWQVSNAQIGAESELQERTKENIA
tara:strand:- start:233 stop:1450 length:1218 start_codon:yes stop_codon:yes gene_type:complete